jgi:hypothetical protein
MTNKSTYLFLLVIRPTKGEFFFFVGHKTNKGRVLRQNNKMIDFIYIGSNTLSILCKMPFTQFKSLVVFMPKVYCAPVRLCACVGLCAFVGLMTNKSMLSAIIGLMT